MRVIYSVENGAYIDAKAAHIFFAEGNTFLAVQDTSLVFSRLDIDPGLFAVILVDDSYNGDNLEVLNYLLSGKFKVFGELFILPRLHLFGKEKIKIDKIQKVYSEPWALALCKNYSAGLLGHTQIEMVQDIDSIIHYGNNSNIDGFIMTESLAKTYKSVHIIKKDICDQKAGALRYLIIGKSFFDLPSEKSDKAIVIFRSNQDKSVFEEILNREQMTAFKFLSRPSKANELEFDYYLEIGFRGLLDLESIENNSTYFNILGIFESGKLFVV